MHRLTPVRNEVPVEHRVATVLFADLSGFTALVESASPVTVYTLVRPLMDELVRLVRVHGGDIQQVLGDGFMAVFGLSRRPEPGRVEDNGTADAAGAALALVHAAKRSDRWLPVHVGIECGELLVSPSWEPARFAVWGRAVIVAKRLCDLAGPDTIHVGPGAFALGGEEAFAELGAVPDRPFRTRLKGATGDISVRSVTSHVDELLAAS